MKQPTDILEQFPRRKYRQQKRKFRSAVLSYVRSMGYAAHVETGCFGGRNLVVGNPEKAKFLITAHYDTCGLLPGLSAVTPCSYMGVFLFLLFRTLLLLLIPSILAGLMLFFGVLWVEIGVFTAAVLITIGLLIFFRINPYSTENDSSGVITLLEIAAGLQKLHRDKVCFVLFDLRHGGFLGSYSYQKAHQQAVKDQICICLDDVGQGDEIFIFPGKKNRTENILAFLPYCGLFGKKKISVRTKGFYPSDQQNFPRGAVICASRRRFRFLFLRKANRGKNLENDETNVNLLRAAILSMVSCSAVK